MAMGDVTDSIYDLTTPPTSDIVINLSLKCPLKCSHCCYSSDMSFTEELSADDVISVIEQSHRIERLKSVHFIGGDPFLHQATMLAATRAAHRRGLSVKATTSAYWASSIERAARVLAPLVEAGLGEITISYDDEHAAFVRLAWIGHAVEAAGRAGLDVRLAVVVGPNSRIRAHNLRQDLGLQDRNDIVVYETRLNATGRAADAGVAADAEAYRGACNSVFRTVQVDASGKIFPCCGVLPHHDALSIGRLSDVGLAESVARARADPLLRWINLVGPVQILVDITSDSPEPIEAGRFNGICAACDTLFTDPALLALARARATEREDWLDAAGAARYLFDRACEAR